MLGTRCRLAGRRWRMVWLLPSAGRGAGLSAGGPRSTAALLPRPMRRCVAACAAEPAPAGAEPGRALHRFCIDHALCRLLRAGSAHGCFRVDCAMQYGRNFRSRPFAEECMCQSPGAGWSPTSCTSTSAHQQGDVTGEWAKGPLMTSIWKSLSLRLEHSQ